VPQALVVLLQLKNVALLRIMLQLLPSTTYRSNSKQRALQQCYNTASVTVLKCSCALARFR
jgi:hypothetical protein